MASALWANRPPVPLALAGALVAALALLPAGYLAIVCLEDLAYALEVVTRPRTLELAARSSGLAAAVTASAIAIAVPLAWLTARTDLPARRVWATLTLLPIAIPSYIGAYAFVSALGPSGLLSDALEPLGVALPSPYGFAGAWLVLTLFTYPLVLVSVRAALHRLDPQLEEAARSMGRSPRQVFATVVVPALVPAIAASGLLVALYVLSDFGAVSITRFSSFTREIYITNQSGFDRVGAAALGAFLVVVTLCVLAVYARVRGTSGRYRIGPGAQRPPASSPLGHWKLPALAFCAGVVCLSLVLPVAVLGVWAARGVGSELAPSAVWVNAGHSLLAGSASAVVAVGLALVVAVLSVRFPGRGSTAIERGSYAGYALPGIVVALALVYFGTRVALPLYQTFAMLVLALVLHFMPLAIGAARTSLTQVSPRTEEAARNMGRGPVSAFLSVTAPQLVGGLAAGAALVFVYAIKELPATLLLAPIGFETLATDVWRQTTFGFYEAGAVPALLLLLLAAPALYLLGDRGAHE